MAGAFVKHSLQIASEGLRAMDGGEQYFPQALGFVPPPPMRLPAALEKVNSQQTEEHNCEPHRNPQQQDLTACDRYTR
jgi:hypothetical protein